MPKKIAAVSGVGGSTTATRSPRPTPRAASRFAARFAEILQLAPGELAPAPSKLSQSIAGFPGGCLSQTSAAMLYRSGTSQRWEARQSS